MVNEESAGPLTPARTPAPPTEVELHPHISGEEDDTQPPIEAKPPKNPVDPDLHTLSASIFLKEIADWDGKSEEIDRTLIAAFEADSYLKCIPDLWPQDIEPLSYINNLDKIIDSLPTDSELRKRSIQELGRACGLYGTFPASYDLASTLSEPDELPISSGAFADFEKLTGREDCSQVFAVKSFRVSLDNRGLVEKINIEYGKVVAVSKRVNHPNVLQVEGVAHDMLRFCIVSKWMDHGNILDYVGKHPTVNRLELLIGVARGLNYLHSIDVVHGGLKCSNILIDAEGNSCLSDFGLWPITEHMSSRKRSAPAHSWALPYSAPELVPDLLKIESAARVGKKQPTNKSDVYSLSMLIVELATGRVPYAGIDEDIVISRISAGRGPLKPHLFEAPGMTPAVWKIAERCWHRKAEKRPELNTVLQYLENLANPGDKRTHGPPIRWWRKIFGG